MKKRIGLLAALLAISIAGQVLLRPCLGSETEAGSVSDAMSSRQVGDLTATGDLLEQTSEDGESNPLQAQLVKHLSLMIGFVALIGVGAWFVCKKMSCGWSSSRGKQITVTETVTLGQRRQLHLVQVGSRQYLISSTGDSIRLLSDVTETLAKEDA
jgi:flagellar biogenesis protein FliO